MAKGRGIQLLVFDWAGTTVDYGSSAPETVFERVFESAGIHLTRDEINRPMGMEKKAHIRQLLSSENGGRQWEEAYGRPWTEDDVEMLYQKFETILNEVVAEYSQPIPGVVETVEKLRRAGYRIGSTTGYTSQIMEKVISEAEKYGYKADCVVTPDLTEAGRPTPFMLFECMRQMNVYPPCEVVKVGDTVVDIQEGKNAGAWSVGILEGSNLLGLTREEYEAMDPEELRKCKYDAAECYRKAGADIVIDTILDLPEAVAELNRRLIKREVEE